jgi:4-amino-4-deoxy-L-arabinose transferase-like glycosyltransferase
MLQLNMSTQAIRTGIASALRALLTLPPSFALLALLSLAFVLPGLFNHSPWKSFDAIGVEIIHQMHTSGDWLVPRLAGEPWLEDPPFFHWAALLSAKVFSFALPFHDAVRVASGLAVLAACAFLFRAKRAPSDQEEAGRSDAATPVLLLIGTIGLMVHAHEAIADLATLAACSAALAALIRADEHPVWRGGAFGLALGIAFLSTGFVAPLGLGAAGLLSVLACPSFRTRKGAVFLAVAAVVALGVASSWPLALRSQAPSVLSAWLAQALQQHGRFGANLSYFFGISAWFLWPLWPLGLWTVWAKRRFLLSPELFVPLAAFALLFAGVAFVGPRQDINLLVTVPPLVLFSAHGLPTLRRGASAAFDWFGVMTFGFFAFLIWGGYFAMMTGWPPKVANNFAKLAPGFQPEFAWLPFVTALVLTLLWLLLVLRLPSAPSRSATRWAAGIVVFWGTFATLWMPWADHIKTYRTVALELKAKLPAGAGCVAGRNFGAPQRAALSYHAGLRIRGPESESRCDFLVVQGTPKHERDAPGAGWRKLADVGRSGDKAERFRLYRKEK